MSKKDKSICKWKKDDLAKDWEILSKLVQESRFACRNCGRSALNKKNLCKPQKLNGVE